MDITGVFGVSEKNDNEKRVTDFVRKGGLCVGNTSSTRVYISTLGWLGAKIEWG